MNMTNKETRPKFIQGDHIVLQHGASQYITFYITTWYLMSWNNAQHMIETSYETLGTPSFLPWETNKVLTYSTT